MEDKVQYYSVIAVRTFLRVLPDFFRRKFLNSFANLIYKIDKKHRNIVKANLEFAFDGRYSLEEKERIAKKVFQNFLFYFADFILSNTRTEEELRTMLDIEGDEYLKEAIKNNEKIILVSSHHSNFELVLKAVGAFYIPVTTVREKLYNSPSLTKLLTEYVETMNVEAKPKVGAVRHLVKALKQGRAIGLAVDQNTESKHGILIDFFGKKARHTITASQLARKFDGKIIPVFVTSEDNRRYKLKFFPPIEIEEVENEDDNIRKLTQKQAQITEEMAREHVEEYFWLHKRFKNQYPEIYR